MSKSIKLSIPEPCHEGWDNMTPNAKGRFCQSCQKTVVDFSLMSDQQIIDYIAKASTNTCGHFYRDQLDRSLVEEPELKKSWWRRGWNVVAASLLLSTASYAQGSVRKKAKTHTKSMDIKPEDYQSPIDGDIALMMFDLVGIVQDSETLMPIEGVTVTLEGKKTAVVTDARGVFKSMPLSIINVSYLNFSAIGYKTAKVPVSYLDRKGPEAPTIYLDKEFQEMDTVVVTAEVSRKVSYSTTGFTVTRCAEELTLFDKLVSNPLVRKIVDTFSSSSVKIYPNPAIAGSILNILLDFSEKGPYKLELFNAIGQLVQLREIDIVKDQQVVTIPLEKNIAKGMYIVRINHQESKKRYTKKVVVN